MGGRTKLSGGVGACRRGRAFGVRFGLAATGPPPSRWRSCCRTFECEGDYRRHIEAPRSYYVSCSGRAGGLPETLVAGSPDPVPEQMHAYEQAAGGGLNYTAEFCWPGLDRGVLAEAMTIFAERVMPLFR